jgi:hypothetical protein
MQGVVDGDGWGEPGKGRVHAGVVAGAGAGSEATMCMWEEVESEEGARDEGRCHSEHPSTIPPHSVSLPPFSSAWQAEARGPAASQAVLTEEEAVRPAGARAGYEVLGAAALLQDQRPVRDDKGVGGGVSGPRRWRMVTDR